MLTHSRCLPVNPYPTPFTSSWHPFTPFNNFDSHPSRLWTRRIRAADEEGLRKRQLIRLGSVYERRSLISSDMSPSVVHAIFYATACGVLRVFKILISICPSLLHPRTTLYRRLICPLQMVVDYLNYLSYDTTADSVFLVSQTAD